MKFPFKWLYKISVALFTKKITIKMKFENTVILLKFLNAQNLSTYTGEKLTFLLAACCTQLSNKTETKV